MKAAGTVVGRGEKSLLSLLGYPGRELRPGREGDGER